MAWTLMKEGGEAENFGAAHKEFMIDSISDIDNEPTQYGSIAPGSFAYTGGYDTIFQKDVNGQWIEVSNGDGPHTLAWNNITGKPTVFPPDGNNLAAKGAVKITATTTGTQPSLNIAQGGPDVTGAASANIGNGNTVSGGQSLAVGAGNTVSGTGSIAVGGGCQATGGCSIAAGSGVKATANGSAAFGGGSEANAASSLAAGGSSTANGSCSVALGGGAIAGSACQIAVGKYNVEDEDDEYAVIVGNGSSSSRSNALTVDWNGNVESAGNLTIHYDGEEIDVGEAITSGGGGGEDVYYIEFTQGQGSSVTCDKDFNDILSARNSGKKIVAILKTDAANFILQESMESITSSDVSNIFFCLANGTQILHAVHMTGKNWIMNNYNLLTASSVVDNLTSTNATVPLSAKQGKVLKDLIDAGSGLTELVLDMTVEQQSAWRQNGRLVFTESQLAQISYENPVDRLVLHGEAGSTVMNIYMYLQGKENLYSKYLKYGSTGGQGDIAGEDDFAALCVTSFCQIKFDNSGESAIEGWYAQSMLPQILDIPNDNGTYVLKCTVSNYIPTLFWEAES